MTPQGLFWGRGNRAFAPTATLKPPLRDLGICVMYRYKHYFTNFCCLRLFVVVPKLVVFVF